MAGADGMSIAEVVREVLRDEHADVIRESVRLVAQELMEAVAELIGAQHGERTCRWLRAHSHAGTPRPGT